MIKKISKVTCKIIKWYLKLCVALWAIIGVAEYADKLTKKPYLKWYDAEEEIFDETWQKYKNYFVSR